MRLARLETWLVMAAAVVGIVGVVGYVVSVRPAQDVALSLDPASGWRETAWRLRQDPWWPSKSFTCEKDVCGARIELYLRVKVGFCDCARGIADDAELERISDLLVLASRADAVGPGRKAEVTRLVGRSRAYRIVATGPEARRRDLVLLGLNSGCDAVVASAIHDDGATDRVEEAMSEFLARAEVLRWTRTALGL